MPKEYAFVFDGSRDAFFDNLSKLPNNYGEFFYFDDFIVERNGDEIRFGVERAGHSGGNWYIPQISEYDDQMEFRGEIQYIGPGAEENAGVFRKAFNKAEEIAMYILLLPLILIVMVCRMIARLIAACRGIKPKTDTTEERLFHLMEGHLKCRRL